MSLIRILHVLGRMNPGGVETWLLHVLRHIDRRRFALDFLVHTREPSAYDEKVRALGARVIPCIRPSHPWAYARNFRRVLRRYGPYEVVHSHVHHFSGFVLRLARRAGVPTRLAHSHNDTSMVDASSGVLRRAYLRAMERWVVREATAGLAASRPAAAALFGAGWESDPRWRVLHYGIDVDPFGADVDPALVRRELGIPRSAFVLGHVGRFHAQKNHLFLIAVAAEASRRIPETRLLLVGDGPLRTAVAARAEELGIGKVVVFAGVRGDVPRLMKGAMDVFVFPSLYEGLGIVFLEAQAAGLPAVVSRAVPEEADVVPSLIRRLPLDAGPAEWAAAALAARGSRPADPGRARSLVAASSFSVTASVRALEEVYAHRKAGGP